MKLMHIKNIKGQILIAFLFINELVQANELPPDFSNDVEDVPGASIDQWENLILIVALFVIYYYSKKQRQIVK
jgi:hypothetical protein